MLLSKLSKISSAKTVYIFDIILKTEYAENTKKLMVLHYSRLSERDQRHYAAIEAIQLGRVGITYISKIWVLTGTLSVRG